MSNELNVLDFLIVIFKRKTLVLIHFIIISIIAFTIALLLPKWYKSEVVFIPKGRESAGLFSIMGDIMSTDIVGGSTLSKRQYKALLSSREIREKLIQKFDLIKVYKKEKAPNPLDQTLKALRKTIVITEEEEGGFGITDVISIMITAIDKNPKRASDMANYLYSLLEEKSLELNREEYRKMTDFLVMKIDQCNIKLDSARCSMNDFQIKNRIYDIPKQVTMVLEAIGVIKAEILSFENRINYLKSIHLNNPNEIKVLEQKRVALEKKLLEMEKTKKKDIFVGLNQSINLSNEFTDLYTEVETYNQLRLLLKQQYEQAKIKKSKNFSSLYLIDAARPAEYKFKPKRAFVIIGIVGIYMLLLISYLLVWNHYSLLRKNNPEKLHKIDLLLQQIYKNR